MLKIINNYVNSVVIFFECVFANNNLIVLIGSIHDMVVNVWNQIKKHVK